MSRKVCVNLCSLSLLAERIGLVLLLTRMTICVRLFGCQKTSLKFVMKRTLIALATFAAIFVSGPLAQAQIATCVYGELFEFNNNTSIVFTKNAANSRLFEAQSIQNGTTFDFSVLDNSPANRLLTTPISGSGHSQDGGTATDGGIRLLGGNGNTTADVDVTIEMSGTPITEIEFYGHDIEDDEVASFGAPDYVAGSLTAHPGAVVGINATTRVATGTANNTNGSSNRSSLATYQNNTGVSTLTMNFGVVNGRIGGGVALGAYCLSLIDAQIESFPDFTGGGVTTSILASDTLNGVILDPADVTLTTGDVTGPDGNPSTAITPNPNGTITIPPNTPAGDYTVEYEICDIINPANCSTAVETVTILPALPELTVTKTTGATGALQGDGSFSQAFTIELENTGNVAINNPTLSDDLEAIFGAAFEPSTEAVTTGGVTIAPTVTANSGNTGTTPSANSAYDGDGSDGLLDGTSGTLDAGDKIAINFTAMFRAHVMSGDVTNSVTANGTAPSGSTLTPDMATSLVLKPALPSPRPTLVPTACGAHLAEGFLTNPLPTEPDVVFGDSTTNDPYVQQYMTRNVTTGEVSIYYSSSDVILNGSDIHSDMTSELVTDRPGVAGQQSELWRLAIRLDGTPGDSINVPIRTENVHEFTTWWLTDTSGAFLGNNDWLYTTRASNPGGDGENFDVSITFPSDGIVYLNIVMSDPVNRRGSFTISASDYTCPAASAVLDAAKTVAMFEPTSDPAYAIPGNDVIYTITVNNSGDGPTDTDSIELIDNMPSSISFWNGDIDFGGPDNFTNTTPVAIDLSSGTGLTFDYTTDVRFGFGASAPDEFADCSPLSPDDTYRDDVTFICLNPKGALSAGSPAPNFSLSFRARIN